MVDLAVGDKATVDLLVRSTKVDADMRGFLRSVPDARASAIVVSE